MILGLFRVLLGFVLACLAAAMVKVGFVVTPPELMAGSEQDWTSAAQLTVFVAIQNFVFAAPFALLAVIVGEWQAIRSWSFYVLTGLAIAAAGFATLYSGENPGQPTIINQYALLAYFAAGLVGGFVYWLFAGKYAGRTSNRDFVDEPGRRRRSGEEGHGRSVIPPKPVVPKSGSAGASTLPPRPSSVPVSKGDR
ncbi:MAG: hypothetical protein RLZ98_881 [Pseudomonadota bacterium]|jgi:hypothetical protein